MSDQEDVTGGQSPRLPAEQQKSPRPKKRSRKAPPTGELILGDLVKRARPKDLWGFVASIGVLLGGAFVGGRYFESMKHPSDESVIADMDPVDAYQQLQEAIAGRDAVQVFKQYLDAAANDQWEDAVRLLYSRSRYRVGPKGETNLRPEELLAYGYRMTKEHRYKGFIPIEVKPDRERYQVDLEFEDWLPNVPAIVEFNKLKLGECLTDARCEQLAADLLRALPDNYEVPNFNRDRQALQSEMLEYVRQGVELREIVISDEILNRFGRDKGFKPIPEKQDDPETGGGAAHRHRMVNATMRLENGQWKFDEYGSFLIEKR